MRVVSLGRLVQDIAKQRRRRARIFKNHGTSLFERLETLTE
jgi:hypothetical protein